MADRVRFLGQQSRAEVREALAAADVFALPTTAEAFGIAVLEARCAGLPVVAMGGNGLVDLIQHGETGLLAGSAAEFADQLALVCADPALRARFGQATAAGLERFDWSHVTSEYEMVYRTP